MLSSICCHCNVSSFFPPSPKTVKKFILLPAVPILAGAAFLTASKMTAIAYIVTAVAITLFLYLSSNAASAKKIRASVFAQNHRPSLTRQTLPIDATVGLGNASQNCWCNSLLQLVFHVPYLRMQYDSFAHFHACNPEHPEKKQQAGRDLVNVLKAYNREIAEGTLQALSSDMSQKVRKALLTINPDCSIRAYSFLPEDAAEGFVQLLDLPTQVERKIPALKRLSFAKTTTWALADSVKDLASFQQDPPLTVLFRNGPAAMERRDGTCVFYQREHLDLSLWILPLDETHKATKITDLIALDLHNVRDQTETFKASTQQRIGSSIQDSQPVQLTPILDIKTLANAPAGISIALNRFTYDRSRQTRVKIKDRITPCDTIHLPLENGEKALYHLQGIVVHLGSSPYGGHYVAYLKRHDGSWILCNDSTVSHVTTSIHTDKGILTGGYIFHYEKA